MRLRIQNKEPLSLLLSHVNFGSRQNVYIKEAFGLRSSTLKMNKQNIYMHKRFFKNAAETGFP